MKKIFITGSTDGIGRLAALKLAKAGHEIILHGRNADKLENTIQTIASESGSTSVRGYVADLSDLGAVKQMAKKLTEEHQTIDVLINNAGVFLASASRLANGMDIRMVVNYLAPVLLTEKLLPALRSADSPRVISLSSAAQAPVSSEALEGKKTLADQDAYAQSKLALLMWSFDMAGKHPAINFIAVNPGSLLNTKMVKEAYGKHWSPADKGADILIDLATAEKHENMSGKYFDNDGGDYGPAHPDAYVKEKIERLIETTSMLLNQHK